MIRSIVPATLLIAMGSYVLAHPHHVVPDALIGAVIVLAGLAMLAVAIIARFRPGL